ncbi:MAG: nucleoside monophosphate kinase [Candidatus Yanofskybacteria bacterium]|nr:nucleoside monophosphate kinase [Candidatus Yanofskybacteria bacterium]
MPKREKIPDFPLFKTKKAGPQFNLEDRAQRRKYFDYKAGTEIRKLKEYLKKNTFMGFFLGPKNSGKGTYAKLFLEALNADLVAHISVGDVVRSVHKSLINTKSKRELIAFLQKRYRGYIPIDKILDIILGRDTKTLLPNEVILALVQREIDKLNRKAVFVDGFPRNLDQVQTSLYFRSLMGYRDDPDFFIFLHVPEAILAERFKARVICPKCQTSRSLKLLRTKQVGYDKKIKEFFLICDNDGARMVPKEGDELGIEAIRGRLEIDKRVMNQLLQLQGVPKIYLRNSIPVRYAKEYVNDYELTPASSYVWDKIGQTVKINEKLWLTKDDIGVPSYSLLAPPIVVALIKQLVKSLDL